MAKIYFILGPSGIGKGTSIDILDKRHPEWFFPVSVTTRRMRSGEKEGEVYNFVSRESFEEMISKGEFLEFAKVHDLNFYGTLKKPILDNLKKGKTVVREIDIQGFLQAREKLAKGSFISIFLYTDNLKLLEERIRHRSKLSEKEIEKRLKSMKKEIAQKEECDFVIESFLDSPIEFFANEIEKIIENHL